MSLSGLLLAILLPTGPFAPAERPVWQQRLHWPATYEQSWINSWETETPDTAGIQLYALNTTLYLVQIQTFHHPQLPRQIFYLYDQNTRSSNALTLAWLSRPPGQPLQANQSVELTGSASFSPTDKVLSLLTADNCGQRISWRFVNGRPMLKEVRARDCATNAHSTADTWPRIWP